MPIVRERSEKDPSRPGSAATLPAPKVAVVAEADEIGTALSAMLDEAGLAVMRIRPDDGPVQVNEGEIDVLVYATESLVDDDLDVVAELSEAFGARRRVVVTTELPPAHAMRRAIRRCVDGIVVAQEAEHALAPTVLAVCASQLVMPASGRAAVEIPLLSYREREILSLAVAGRTNDEIARQLFLATSTVKSHLSASFAKLNVHSRTEAASVLHELEGELPPTGPQTVGDVA